jgi:hypothetical protein
MAGHGPSSNRSNRRVRCCFFLTRKQQSGRSDPGQTGLEADPNSQACAIGGHTHGSNGNRYSLSHRIEPDSDSEYATHTGATEIPATVTGNFGSNENSNRGGNRNSNRPAELDTGPDAGATTAATTFTNHSKCPQDLAARSDGKPETSESLICFVRLPRSTSSSSFVASEISMSICAT